MFLNCLKNNENYKNEQDYISFYKLFKNEIIKLINIELQLSEPDFKKKINELLDFLNTL
jgi:hypothetical protein